MHASLIHMAPHAMFQRNIPAESLYKISIGTVTWKISICSLHRSQTDVGSVRTKFSAKGTDSDDKECESGRFAG